MNKVFVIIERSKGNDRIMYVVKTFRDAMNSLDVHREGGSRNYDIKKRYLDGSGLIRAAVVRTDGTEYFAVEYAVHTGSVVG